MKNKSLKKNYLLNLIYQILTIIVPFITTPYISRVLQAEGIGAYSYTLAVASYVGIFVTMGMDIYGQLQAAKCRSDRHACSNLVFGIFSAKLLTTLMVISVYFVIEPIVGMYGSLYWIMILYFLSLLTDFTWFFQGLEEFGCIIFRNVLMKIVGIACIFGFVKELGDVGIYALIMQGTILLGNLLIIPYLRKFVSRIPFTQLMILPHIKGGIIYFIPTIATSVYTILDKAMIGWITKSSNENGYYEQAYKIIQMVLVVVTSLRTVTLPRIVHLYNEKNYEAVIKVVDRTIKFVLLISLPMSTGLIMVAPELVPIFLGKDFEESILIVQVLAVLVVVLGLSVLISGQCLTAMGKQKQANVCVIVGAVINFIMNLILIPSYGALGAAIATVCAETIILIMFFVFSREHINISIMVKEFFKYLLCSILMAGVIHGLSYIGLEIEVLLLCKVLVGVIVYFGGLVLIRDDLIVNFFHSIMHRSDKE